MKKLNLLLLVCVLAGFACSCQLSNNGAIADFDSDNMDGWTTTGDLNSKPYNTDMLPTDVTGFEGSGVLNTGHNQLEKMGIASSPEFTINKKYINFLVLLHTLWVNSI